MNGLILGEQWSAYFEAFGIAEFTIGQMTSCYYFPVWDCSDLALCSHAHCGWNLPDGVSGWYDRLGVFEALIAAVAGAWLYQEGETYGP